MIPPEYSDRKGTTHKRGRLFDEGFARSHCEEKSVRTSKPITARLGRIGLAFAALVSIAAVATPAAADSSDDGTFNERSYRGNINDCNHRDCRHAYQHHRHRQHDNDGFFSFGLGGPVYSDPPYYYAPAPQYYYPPPTYYQPGPSFNLTIPLGN